MNFERLLGGGPLFPATEPWERFGTANSGACLVERNAETDRVIASFIGTARLGQPDLADGYVVMLSSAAGELIPGKDGTFRGLCILTPKLELVYKHPDPVLTPIDGAIDSHGVEDARLTWENGVFYAWYCGYNGVNGRACAAWSKDLLHWERSAPLPGNINSCDNKDHVVFPEKIGGKYYMLHRPWGLPEFKEHYNMPIRLAVSESLSGPWDDLGILMKPRENPEHAHDWLGGGAAPIPLGNGQYLEIYHTACFQKDGYRVYGAAAALLDFNRFEASNPQTLVTHRLEPLLMPSPEYPNECNAQLRLDNVFPMAAYRYGEDLYLAYGAGDKVSCGARCKFAELLAEVKKHPV